MSGEECREEGAAAKPHPLETAGTGWLGGVQVLQQVLGRGVCSLVPARTVSRHRGPMYTLSSPSPVKPPPRLSVGRTTFRWRGAVRTGGGTGDGIPNLNTFVVSKDCDAEG